jgi:hypothetical protein
LPAELRPLLAALEPLAAAVQPLLDTLEPLVAQVQQLIAGAGEPSEPGAGAKPLDIEPLAAAVKPLVANLEPLIAALEPLIANLEPLVAALQPAPVAGSLAAPVVAGSGFAVESTAERPVASPAPASSRLTTNGLSSALTGSAPQDSHAAPTAPSSSLSRQADSAGATAFSTSAYTHPGASGRRGVAGAEASPKASHGSPVPGSDRGPRPAGASASGGASSSANLFFTIAAFLVLCGWTLPCLTQRLGALPNFWPPTPFRLLLERPG